MAKIKMDDGDLIEMLDKRVGISDRMRMDRLQLDELMMTCMAYYSGRQRFSISGGRIFDAFYDDDGENVSYKVNLVRARVHSGIAKILEVRSEFAVRPVDASTKARQLAELSNRVYEHMKEVSDWKRHQFIALLWKAVCGFAYLKVVWNPNKGEPERFYLSDPPVRTVIPESMLTPEQRTERVALDLFEDMPSGDVGLSVISPFSGRQDWSSRDAGMEGCHWFAERHWVDIDRVAEAYGIDEDDLQATPETEGLHNYEEAIAHMHSGSGSLPISWDTPRDKIGKRCLYVEMWQRPDSGNKKGLRVVYAGGRIVRKGHNPHIRDRSGWSHIPYVKDDWQPHAGRFASSGMVEDMIGPQFYLNEVRSLKLQFMRIKGLPDTYVGDRSGIDTDNMLAGGGRIYSVSEMSAVKVQHGPVPQMPVEVAQIGLEVESDLNKVASQSEVQAQAIPGDVRSGSAVRMLQQERFIGLSIPTECSMRTARDVGRILLTLGQMFYGPERVLKYLGKGNEWVVEKFNGADLVNDLVIIGQPSIMDTQSAQREEMLDAISAGAFNPQLDENTRTLILKALHYNTSDEIVRAQIQAETNQEIEIEEMLADPLKYGEIGYPVAEWEDHNRHVAVLLRYMNSLEFRNRDPNAKAIITKHWKDHQMFQVQAQMQEMQLLEAAKGAPGEKGQASQPRAK